MNRKRALKPKKTKKPKPETRKQTYAEAHKPENLNPRGLTEQIILKNLNKGIMVIGPPPKDRHFTSPAWSMGMKFVFDVAEDGTSTEVDNWYMCEICGTMYNTVLKGGTGNLLKHMVGKHSNPTYKFTKDDLVNLLQKVAESAIATAVLPDFKKIIPPPDKW